MTSGPGVQRARFSEPPSANIDMIAWRISDCQEHDIVPQDRPGEVICLLRLPQHRYLDVIAENNGSRQCQGLKPCTSFDAGKGGGYDANGNAES